LRELIRPPNAFLAAHAERIAELLGHEPARWLLVETDRQVVSLVEDAVAVATWPCSTATVGVDPREGSGGTPPGLHRIAARIGAGAPSGAVFDSREPTGEIWHAGLPAGGGDLILTRILTLEGLEEGVNRGPGVDSLARYIYLHGTNHEDRIGEPSSHGCVRLRNDDIADLFARVAEGDPVVIA
jgi:lipoprotein-anchoring transpeptidase ErfK/SrfK